MNTAQADITAAKARLQTQGWVSRRSEFFRHLPPPELQQWLTEPADEGSDAQPAARTDWTLHPLDDTCTRQIDACWLDALDAVERSELFARLPAPGGDDAPFAWAHRALCRQGLRLRISAREDGAPVQLHLRHRPLGLAEAPLLVLEIEQDARCVLLETHERSADRSHAEIAQNLQLHVMLARGARLHHLRVVAPDPGDRIAHFVHATLARDAHYAQAMAATGSDYHLQRTTVQLQGPGAQARSAGVLLTNGRTLDQQVHTHMNAARTVSNVEILALASGRAHAVANACTRIAAGSDDADVRQRLSGIALDGQPHMVLRPHLEILHDQVQAVHGATWGTLPQDALFYASQRGLDPATARALIAQGMARALLERKLEDPEQPAAGKLLADWLEAGWLARAIAHQLAGSTEAPHG